jgi:hypothetical protein
MIRTDRFTIDVDTFAAERRRILERSDERLTDPVRAALTRLGLPGWEDGIIAAALDIFDETAREEIDEWNPIIDDMRDEFQRELRETLHKTKPSEEGQFDHQVERMVRWLSTYSVNAGTEAATTSDPDGSVGLEWVTMGDSNVRETHVETNGETVPSGQPFDVAGYELLYPGQPVGPPEIWINCRCVARPYLLEDFKAKTVTASAEPITTSVIVALPAADDPISAASSEEDGAHATLLFLGESANLDGEALKAAVGEFVAKGEVGVLSDKVNGRATLGADSADVVLLDAASLVNVRNGLLEQNTIVQAHQSVEQYPTWIPHVTLGYPEKPAVGDYAGESITFDRLALWHGEDHTEFPLGKAKVIHSEDPEFSQQMADAFFASVPEGDTPEDEDDAPMVPLEEEYEPVPWYGVLAPEGAVSGDGRGFTDGGLRMRDLPLPLKWMPEDAEGHDKSKVSGRIDRIWREDGLIKAEGFFDTSYAAYEAIRQIAEGSIRGVSVDIDDMQASLSEDGESSVATGRICSATLCAIPAFAEVFVALGTWADDTGRAFGSSDIPDGRVSGDRQPEEEFAVSRETFVSESPWDGSASRFSDEQWKRSCILHVCDGMEKTCHKLPIREPGGALSRAGVHAAAGRIGQAQASPEQISAAKAKLRGAYKELGETPPDSLTAGAPPITRDGPGWITHPKPTERVTDYWVHGRGALKIRWGQPGDFNRCRVQLVKYVQNPEWLAGLCANLHYRALHIWPGQHSGRTQDMTLTASAGEVLAADWFKNPHLTGPTPFTVTDEGRVYGHVATWDTCHIGLPIGDEEGECTTAPHSGANYGFFLTGEVQTDLGPVAVGQITMGGGHADHRAGFRAAISHYDSTSTAVADVTAGEDDHGIWVAGALRSTLSVEQVRELRAAAISGDWRTVKVGSDDLEMVAALAVNVPGFPIPRPSMLVASSGERLSLTAASIPLAEGQSFGDTVEIPTTPAEKFNIVRSKFRQLQVARAKAAFSEARG